MCSCKSREFSNAPAARARERIPLPRVKKQRVSSTALLARDIRLQFSIACATNEQEEATPAAPAEPASTTADGEVAADTATAAPAVVTATDAAAEAMRLAKRVERFGRIAPVTESEVAEKMAMRREKFGLPEPVSAVVRRNTCRLGAVEDLEGWSAHSSGVM